jgi:hypothetical protein
MREVRPFGLSVAALALALVSASCGADTSVAPGEAGEWLVSRDAENALVIRYPPDWDATTAALNDVVWPSHHLVVASFPLAAARTDTGCAPIPVVEPMPPGSAFIVLFEYAEGQIEGSPWVREVPSRPASFTLEDARFANYECYGASYMIRFVDQGRVFQAHVSFGDGATDETRATALAVLDSLEVSARP